MIFAAAPSQNEVLAALVEDKTIPWERIRAFHMDEYVGISSDAPQGFAMFLKNAIFDKVPFKSVELINCSAEPELEVKRYSALLEKYPCDIVCMGIGENGHIAFNDPWVADFNDPAVIKPVPLDEVCRNQQVHDGCFPTIDDVPTHAFTLTIPSLTNAGHLFCSVPAATKAEAVYRTCNEEITEACPATIMRRHDHAVMYVDPDSGRKI